VFGNVVKQGLKCLTLHKTMPTVFVLWVQKLALLFAKLFLFYKNMLYKKIEFEICEIGRFLKRI